LSQRIWIGFQVIVEFLNNRHEAISDQKNKFATVRNLLEEASAQYDRVFATLGTELGKLKLKQRHSLIDPDKFITEDNIATGKIFIEDFLTELLILENKQSDVNDRDQIKDIVLKIFDGKIGEAFSRKELDEIYKNGEKRYENNVPPGYKDKSKQGAYTVGDSELVRKFGDLILWKEIIKKAKAENIASVVLVTGDVKEDWWLEKRGKKLGARKELLNEIYTDAPCVKNFYMYDTASFLRHAKSRLKAEVKDSSITQAKDLIEKGRQSRVVAEEGYIFLPDLIKLAASHTPILKVGIGRSVHSLPAAKLNGTVFLDCLFELYENVIHHGIHQYVGVQAKDRGDNILLRFKNKISPTATTFHNDLGEMASSLQGSTGLKKIRDYMDREGIPLSLVRTEKTYTLEFSIPKSRFFGKTSFDSE
jgi:hypothetical protein